MPGLLDFMNSPEGMGLLSAVAGGMAGARRGQPWNNFGKAGVAGLVGYANAQDDLMKQQQFAEAKKTRDMEMAVKQMQLDQLKKSSDFYSPENMKKFTIPAQAERTTFAAGPLFGQEALGMTPDYTPMTTPGKPEVFDMAAYRQAMLGSGVPEIAKEGLAMMQKSTPKVKDWKEVRINGQTLYAPYFEDGTAGNPVPYEIAQKLHMADTGGAIQGLDPYTATPVGMPISKTQSPESIAYNKLGWANFGLSKDRLTYEKQQGSKPVFNADAGGFVFAPNAENPQGKVVKTPGFSKPMNDTQAAAAGYADRMSQAEYIMSDPNYAKNQKPEKTAQFFRAIPSFGLGDAVGNQLETANRQQVRQAQEDFVRAKLRKESGAVIGDVEMANEIKTYFPQIGDSQKVIKQKEQARKTAIEAMQRQAGQNYSSPSDRRNEKSIFDQADAILKGQ